MSSARLQARVPSAKRIGVYALNGYVLDFSMHGFDDSAKCNGRKTNNHEDDLFGVLFSMNANERHILDFNEQLGEGYEIINTAVTNNSGESQPCFLYTALRLQEHLLPFSWYHHHVLFGAQEAGLPTNAIQSISRMRSTPDKDTKRHQEQMAIYN
ncbi:MAG: gamma-glutamylcyclotransferase [Sinobacterium sp.]|nr:gamma-glutamylcyclotransferase [Sinobacterium sp.]